MKSHSKKTKKELRVIELFAGVGGFRIGLDRASHPTKGGYKTVWNNQWEPATKKQHASEVYVQRFGAEGHSNENISKVPTKEIPDHDLLVGGFPCQDYSVARVLSHAKGLEGKKGVLWWEIHRILKEKGKKAPACLMLENVDRLLKSPASQRGRDFAVMLASLSDLGYAVEWRVINAADYGMPQRRRRIYILGYKKGSILSKKICASKANEWLFQKGLMANSFPVKKPQGDPQLIELKGDLSDITKNFNKKNPGISPFQTAGMMFDRKVWSAKAEPLHEGPRTVLSDILLDETGVPEEYFIKRTSLPEWKYLKGSKNEKRSGKNGFTYQYSEGPIAFPDHLDKPSRTIITGEGGPSPSRFKHVVKTKSGKLRRLTPIELERLNMFPDDHTVGVPDTKRAFFMGNALVVGVVEKLGRELLKHVSSSPSLANA